MLVRTKSRVNFCNSTDGSTDPDCEDLAGKAAKLKTELEDLKDDRESKGKDKKLDGKIKKKEREFNLAKVKLDMYKTKAASKGKPTEQTRAILLDLQRQIDTLEAGSKKHAHKKKADKGGAEKPAQEIPDIAVRTATGLSAASTTGEVRHRK
jgi:chromosome segregation ATPase